jgi:TRAP-type C4-dicarboxylate transport system permease small subunit
MHMLEQAQDPILSAVAHEAAGPAIAHEENSNPVLSFADRLIGTGVEVFAAVLVAAEVLVLFAGVVSRYVFHSPIVWSDELASFLFLWLAMLGSVVAYRNAEHMRMTALVSKSSLRVQTYFDVLAGVASVAFLLLTIGPALEFAHEERLITTPALEISGAWRASALPVGLGLMLITGLISLLRSPHRLTALSAILTIAVAVGVLYALGNVLPKLGNYNLLIFFVFVVGALVFAGVPIAFAFGLATVGYISLTTRVPTLVVIGRDGRRHESSDLLAVPLFVFLGLHRNDRHGACHGGLSREPARPCSWRSFLCACRCDVSGVGISGSKAADMAAVAPVLFPEMRSRGAKEGDLVALLSATGAQTETIPPSIVLITIGSVTGVSISALFTGGLLPAFVLGITLCFLVWWRYRREDLSSVQRPTRKVIRSLAIALPRCCAVRHSGRCCRGYRNGNRSVNYWYLLCRYR